MRSGQNSFIDTIKLFPFVFIDTNLRVLLLLLVITAYRY
jgi:hypothetical protein